MAEGCDLYFCEAVLALREDHSDITLEAAVPFAGQAEHWGAAQRQRYEALLARCDTVTVLQEHYSPGCMMKRNRYMVDHADLIIACYDGKSGGIAQHAALCHRARYPDRASAAGNLTIRTNTFGFGKN